MTVETYQQLKTALIEDGYGHEIDWKTNLKPVSDPITFRDEIVWVILNSGMKEQICRIIAQRIRHARENGLDISTAFNHVGKVNAIKFMFASYERLFNEYLASNDKIQFLQTIPFLGTITKYHAAKSLGLDCVKPDRHLVRIAKDSNQTVNEMCALLSEQSGDKVSVVDIILWRSANLGWI